MCGGMFGGAPSMPPPPPPPPPPPEPPKMADAAVQKARQDEITKARALSGSASTVLTGGLGDQSAASTDKKTLLGQ